jgi:hypothetical protein
MSATNNKAQMGIAAVLIWLSIFIAAIAGWIMNLVAIVNHDFALEVGLGIVRVIGVFIAPIGAVLGYI